MKRLLQPVGILSLLLISSQSSAVGLGELKVLSTLNQALHAEVEILEAGNLSAEEIVISIASHNTFAKYQIDRPLIYDEITVEPVAAVESKTTHYRLQSHSFIHEPFLHLIVEARWPGGRVLREYTALLDLPAPIP
ncbi:type IV pilus assembly protein FimV [Cellvibrio polysaccharolyticus]|uniref:FimV N-terminal domain-containing protein n=1 Tax=Cellvibrio polysaccharolyticus TaxID=2082724 RepID=A0A928V579_9GAMM|nr:hypothetical protein [Cellvibrio polysaccharolyticus]MBE8718083.1 hypothetical protein [Cellvibrio polysaccharolyticus]